jgi:DNA (cytosine-5)-methyltransferase 1
VDEHLESELADGAKPVSNGGERNVADTENWLLATMYGQREVSGTGEGQSGGSGGESVAIGQGIAGEGRWNNFPSVSPVHRGNDGLPFDVDRLTISFGKWRTEALKAYGNAIVPQVMYEIFRAIDIIENHE